MFVQETQCKRTAKHFRCLCLLNANEIKFFMMNDFSFQKSALFHTTEIYQYVNSCLDNTQSIVQTHTRNSVRYCGQ